MTDYPNELSDDAHELLKDAAREVRNLTIEDRGYALERSDLPDDMRVREDDNGLPYVVHGEQPLADEIVVSMDGDDARIGVAWSSRKGHYQERHYARDVYDAMAEAGIDPPTTDRLGENLGRMVGVQFGTGDEIMIENIVLGARE